MQTTVSNGEAAARTPPVGSHCTHLYCISPDAPTNPVIYWLGAYDDATVKFQLDGASGPFRLDLGDTIYAPNIFEDAQGRCVLWAWVQEHRAVGSYDFSGCMATPRVLLQREGRLVQQPLPELREVRSLLQCSNTFVDTLMLPPSWRLDCAVSRFSGPRCERPAMDTVSLRIPLFATDAS
jgi:sucrose-6-phosphate hydrolase SacC (GH32 family)